MTVRQTWIPYHRDTGHAIARWPAAGCGVGDRQLGGLAIGAGEIVACCREGRGSSAAHLFVIGIGLVGDQNLIGLTRI